MGQGIYVKFTESDFRARVARVRVGKDSSRVAEDVVQKIILHIVPCQWLCIVTFDRKSFPSKIANAEVAVLYGERGRRHEHRDARRRRAKIPLASSRRKI